MGKTWLNYSPFELNAVPNEPCVYCITIDGVVVYVGSTRRFRSRFYEHKIRYGYANNIVTPWGTFGRSINIQIKVGFSKIYGDWAMRELRLIKKLRPCFNIAHKNPRIQK